ncbi:MAG: aspartyl-phosphate phosphatase Spo0E family protein [Bacillota bacterium]
MTMPALLVRIERMRRRLQYLDNPEKRLKLSQELDKLLNKYYRLRATESTVL